MFIFFLACSNVIIVGKHLPGAKNRAADALSQDDKASFLSQVPSAHGDLIKISQRLLEVLVLKQPDWTELLFSKGLADSTQRTYQSAQKRFLTFCREGDFKASQVLLCRYVSYLAEPNLKYKTIKAYLSIIRFLHIAEGAEDPFEPNLLRLQYVL